MTRQEIKLLTDRVVSGLATEEEILLYNRLYNSLEEQQVEMPDDKQQIGLEMQQAIQERIGSVTPVRSFPLRRWIAAAAAIAAIVTSGYFFFGKKEHLPADIAISRVEEKTITSGSNKAMLTLDDGSVIALNDKQSDTVNQQGGITAINAPGGLLSYSGKSTTVSFNTITTPVAGQYRLVLADGSKVWLNAASRLHFPTAFPGSNRVVELSGEAYFEVSPDAKKPFLVKTGELTVEVLGTHFNVNAYSNENAIKTTLLEGSVRVRKDDQHIIISPNEQVVFAGTDRRLQKITGVQIEEIIAWKEGRFRFSKMPIDAVMRQIERWYDVSVEFRGKMSQELFSGDVSRQENVNQLLDILGATNFVTFNIEGKKIIVNSLK